MEAVDDRNVLIVFVACQVIESRTGIEIEIWNELREFERKPVRPAPGRTGHPQAPAHGCRGRAGSFDIIDQAQIALRPEHIASGPRSTTLWPLTDSCLTTARKENGCALRPGLRPGHGTLARITGQAARSELVGCPSSDLQDRLSDAGDALESSAPSNATNEPTDTCENETNEPTDAYPRERKVLKRSTSRIKIMSRIKNEDRRPTVTCENVTNEPTVDREFVTNEPRWTGRS